MREDSVLSPTRPLSLAEFTPAADSFRSLEQRIEDEVVQDFERITITAEGVDWEREGCAVLRHLDYLVGENPFVPAAC